jgi:SAM-dependent methyltransferase
MDTPTQPGFKDHFSGHASSYEAYRPNYPVELFRYLASLVQRRGLAWDCATGNGQAAVALAPYFDSVIGTDASQQQIMEARPNEKVRYTVARGEQTEIADASVDLVTVAQALHWFDMPKFYAEVNRVVRPGGMLAVWCYTLQSVSPEVDSIAGRLYSEIAGKYWPPERRIVEDGYATIPFPFHEIKTPEFRMLAHWDLDHFLGYLGTWSSVRRYADERKQDPIALIRGELANVWGDSERDVTWPLFVRVGRVHV